MTAVNFMINSDFKWVLLAMALIWAASIAACRLWISRICPLAGVPDSDLALTSGSDFR
jgi:hypothetical protein